MQTKTDLLMPSERQRLLDAMARVCARHGYANATIEQVAADAGSSPEAFEEHFGSKEACLVEAAETVLADGMGALSGGYSLDATPWESSVQALRAMLELFAARPALAHLAVIGARQMSPPAIRTHYEAGFGVLSAMLGRLRRRDRSGADLPVGASRAAIGGCEALLRREIAAGRAESMPLLLPDLVYMATVSLLGQAEALRLMRRANEVLRGSAWG